jgi:2-oxoglutarate ferredoxin oxidoreductase subunit delta
MAKRGKVLIDRERCKGCLLCVRACPCAVLAAERGPNEGGAPPVEAARAEACIACANCFEVCPDAAIAVYELEEGDGE